jgi:hypothetical protein
MDGTKAKKDLLAVLHVGHLTRQLPVALLIKQLAFQPLAAHRTKQ